MPQNGNVQPSSLQNRNPVYQHCYIQMHMSQINVIFFSMLYFADAFFSLFLFTYLILSYCIIFKAWRNEDCYIAIVPTNIFSVRTPSISIKCFLKIRGENIRKSRMLISQPRENSLLSALVFIKYCVAMAKFFQLTFTMEPILLLLQVYP